MRRKPVIWAEEVSPQLSQLIKKKKCAILPIGSTEQHGSHLPVGTDHINVWAIAKKVAKLVNGIVLPLIPYGCSSEHFPRSGTLSLNPQTLKLIIKEII
ncbi:MAG: creatininase family protein, partial [Candidatus Bathyarchaeia archaeon]